MQANDCYQCKCTLCSLLPYVFMKIAEINILAKGLLSVIKLYVFPQMKIAIQDQGFEFQISTKDTCIGIAGSECARHSLR